MIDSCEHNSTLHFVDPTEGWEISIAFTHDENNEPVMKMTVADTGELRLTLPKEVAQIAVEQGWGVDKS